MANCKLPALILTYYRIIIYVKLSVSQRKSRLCESIWVLNPGLSRYKSFYYLLQQRSYVVKIDHNAVPDEDKILHFNNVVTL